MNVQALRQTAKEQGRVAIFDIPAKKWRIVYGPDAREMIRAGTGSLDGPDDAEADVPVTADPLLHLRVMEPTDLAKLAGELGVRNAGKLSRDELVKAIAAKQAEAEQG